MSLYGILQEGGLEKHEIISATDKDLEPVFEKFCELSCWGIFSFTTQIGVVDQIYSDEECE